MDGGAAAGQRSPRLACGLTLSASLPAHVLEEELPQVSDPAEPPQFGLAVEVLHLLGGQFDGDLPVSGFQGPAGHRALFSESTLEGTGWEPMR